MKLLEEASDVCAIFESGRFNKSSRRRMVDSVNPSAMIERSSASIYFLERHLESNPYLESF